MTNGWELADQDDGAPGRRRAPLGHGGALGLLVALPVAALTLVGAGRALGPHPPPPPRPVAATTTAATQVVDRDAEWCFHTPPPGVPDRIPRGYRFLWDFGGSYGARGQESTWVYNRSCADPDANYPVLVIDITDDGGAPSPMGPHGRSVSLNAAHATAMYYQRWMPPVLHTVLCSGGYWPGQQVDCRWDEPTMNLLLVRTSQQTYAILGGRVNGIGERELASIAQRLPGAHAAS